MLRLLCRKLRPPSAPLLLLLRRPIASNPSPSAADADLALLAGAFRSHGIPDDVVGAIVSKQPRILTMSPEKTLGPKLAFLRFEGFSGPELAAILLRNPSLLFRSLDRCLSPLLAFLTSFLASRADLLRVLRNTHGLLTPDLPANIQALRDRGLPDALISKLVLLQPRSLACRPDQVVAALEYAEKLGLRPTNSTFVFAVGVLTYMARPTFLRKMQLYRELGWTEEEVLTMFRLQPGALAASDETIKKKVRYFRDKMGWGPELLCSRPSLMKMSLEKRIVPRCAVLNVLMSKGLLKKSTMSRSKLLLTEEAFVENYVRKYEKIEPRVVRAYEGKIKFRGWDWLKDTEKRARAAGES